MVAHALISFDQFLTDMTNIVLQESRGKLELSRWAMQMIMGDFGNQKTLTPSMARRSNFTYGVNLFVKETAAGRGQGEEVCIGVLPIMIGSRWDAEPLEHGDPGGYFIVKGNEYVLVSQERPAPNRISVTAISSSAKPFTHVAEVQSARHSGMHGALRRSTVRLKRTHTGNLRVDLPGVDGDLPLAVVLKALCAVGEDRPGAEDVNSLVAGGSDPEMTKFLRATAIDNEAYPLLFKDAMESLLYIGSKMWPRRQQAVADRAGDEEADEESSEDEAEGRGVNPDGEDASGSDDDPPPADVAAADDIDDDDQQQQQQQQQQQHPHAVAAKDMLHNRLLPHVSGGPAAKAQYLGYMAARLLRVVLKRVGADDRDSVEAHRLNCAGPLMEQVFRVTFRIAIKRLMMTPAGGSGRQKSLGMLVNKFALNGVEIAMRSGMWPTGKRGMGSNNSGVCQAKSNANLTAVLSHVRRVRSAVLQSVGVSRAGSHVVGPRLLHESMRGLLCPVETPDGESVGLVRNLALSATVTTRPPPGAQQRARVLLVDWLGVCPSISPVSGSAGLQQHAACVFVDGEYVGATPDGANVASKLREVRNSIGGSPSISHDAVRREVHVRTDAGRLARPMLRAGCETDLLRTIKLSFVGHPSIDESSLDEHNWGMQVDGVKDVHAMLIDALAPPGLWALLVKEGLVTLIDAAESANAVSAGMTDPFPAAMFGVAMSGIPFGAHNPGTRCTFQSGMAKQAMGLGTTPHRQRDVQVPLVETTAQMVMVAQDDATRALSCCGVNAIVACMVLDGNNQEDSIIFNKASIDRGMFVADFFMVTHDEPLPPGTPKESIAKVGDIAANNKPLVAGGRWHGRRHPVGKYEEVMQTKTKGADVVKARVRCEMLPNVGDKFSSRHGQKGVIGTIVAQEDMPFTSNGMSPDVVINPHAFPTRMTIGQIIEGIAAKAAALEGKRACDWLMPGKEHAVFVGTPQAASLRGESAERDTEDHYIGRLADMLHKHGYSGTGEETMTSGTTGMPLRARVMIGPTYYQRLMHVSSLKACSRGADGSSDLLTRQPVDGLARGGGMKIGEMELQCVIAHGTMRVLEDRMFLHSDPFTIEVHRESGLMPTPTSKRESPHDLVRVKAPYSLKLLLQELAAMNIVCRLELK